MSRESAEIRLDRLRRRLTYLVATVAFVGIAGLALTTTIVDGRLRADRFDTELQGRAFRSAALVFFDPDADDWNVDGVVDDLTAESVDAILVVDRTTGDTLVATADIENANRLIADAVADDAEQGSLGTVVVDGRRMRAAGAPYFGAAGEAGLDSDGVAGAVIVAAERTGDGDRSRLVGFVWGSAGLLMLVAGAVGWMIAGRIVRPLGAELDREEAFLATAAHELRTPLGRFQAVTESTLMSTQELPESAVRREVVSGLRRLLQLNREMTNSVDDLLLVGRIDAGALAGRRERIRLDELLAGFESTIPELAVDTSGAVEIVGDPALVHHALSNLIENSRRHGRRSDRALLIEASVRTEGTDAVVVVADNGPGLGSDPESLFARHHGRGINGGLGLWIVRGIVDDHDGTVVGSDRPTGAVFEVRFPALRAASPGD